MVAADKGSGAGGSASAEIGKYLDILAKDPGSRVFAPLAEAYRKAGLLDDAIETAREGLTVHPNYMGGRVALGRALFEKRQLGEAAEEMRKVVKAAPDNIIAHKVLGQIALAQGSLPDAEKSFRMVVLLDPHDKEARQALVDIGADGPAPAVPSAATVAPAPSAAPPVPASAPAAEKSWGEVTLDGGAPMEGLERHQAPADTAPAAAPPEPFPMDEIAVGPSAIELEEPDEGSAPLPELDFPLAAPEGAAPVLPDLPEIEVQAPEAVEPAPIELEAPPPFELPAIALPDLPAAVEPEPAGEFEVFGREPAGDSMSGGAVDVSATQTAAPATGTPAEEESPFEVFGRAKRGGPPSSAKGEREAYAEIEIEPTGHGAVADGPDANQDSVFEIFTREPRVDGGAAPRPGHAERSAFEQIDVEPTAYVPPELREGELPVIELREEIPRIDMQTELERVLELEQAPADAIPDGTAAEGTVGEPVMAPDIVAEAPAAAEAAEFAPPAEETGWEEESPWQAVLAATAEDAAPLLTPEEAATEELVWGVVPEPAPEPTSQAVDILEPVAGQLPAQASEIIPEPAAQTLVEPVAGIIPEPVAAAAVEAVEYAGGEAAVPAWAPPAEEIFTLEEEIPSVDLAGEVLPEEPAGEQADEAAVEIAAAEGEDAFADFDAGRAEPVAGTEPPAVAEAVAAAAAAAPATGRGVFDTETLASIYINQGFYGRAAAIYERLAGANPEDAGLRRRLEEVRGLERAHSGAPAAGAAAPETTPAGRDRAETIRRLEALLAAFRGVKAR